jgi:hypothetical protein
VAGNAVPVPPCPARVGAVERQRDGGRGELEMLGIEAEQGGVTQTAGRQQQQARSRTPRRSPGQAAAIRTGLEGDGGGARRRLAPLRAARSTVFTAGSRAGAANPRWRCMCAMALARRATEHAREGSVPALLVAAASCRKPATVAAAAGSGHCPAATHHASKAAQSAA